MDDLSTFDVTFTFIAICAGSLFFFSVWIGPLRGKLGILRGDGGNSDLFKRIRIHGNFIENAPLVALLLLAGEALRVGDGWLWAVVVSFFAGRVYHCVRYDEMDRGLGMALTTMPPVALSIYVLLVLSGGV